MGRTFPKPVIIYEYTCVQNISCYLCKTNISHISCARQYFVTFSRQTETYIPRNNISQIMLQLQSENGYRTNKKKYKWSQLPFFFSPGGVYAFISHKWLRQALNLALTFHYFFLLIIWNKFSIFIKYALCKVFYNFICNKLTKKSTQKYCGHFLGTGRTPSNLIFLLYYIH